MTTLDQRRAIVARIQHTIGRDTVSRVAALRQRVDFGFNPSEPRGHDGKWIDRALGKIARVGDVVQSHVETLVRSPLHVQLRGVVSDFENSKKTPADQKKYTNERNKIASQYMRLHPNVSLSDAVDLIDGAAKNMQREHRKTADADGMLTLKFNPEQMRDPHSGKWVDNPAGGMINTVTGQKVSALDMFKTHLSDLEARTKSGQGSGKTAAGPTEIMQIMRDAHIAGQHRPDAAGLAGPEHTKSYLNTINHLSTLGQLEAIHKKKAEPFSHDQLKSFMVNAFKAGAHKARQKKGQHADAAGMLALKFDPAEHRDKNGRWTKSGAASKIAELGHAISHAHELAKYNSEGAAAHQHHKNAQDLHSSGKHHQAGNEASAGLSAIQRANDIAAGPERARNARTSPRTQRRVEVLQEATRHGGGTQAQRDELARLTGEVKSRAGSPLSHAPNMRDVTGVKQKALTGPVSSSEIFKRGKTEVQTRDYRSADGQWRLVGQPHGGPMLFKTTDKNDTGKAVRAVGSPASLDKLTGVQNWHESTNEVQPRAGTFIGNVPSTHKNARPQ